MKKGFEKSFMKLQSQYVALCLEVLDNSVEKIYIYLSIEEKSKMFNVFVRKTDGIYTLNKLGIERELYMRLLKQGTQDIEKVEKLCKKYKAPTPTEMKMVYDVVTGKYQADYQYEPVCTVRSAGEIFMDWIKEETVAYKSIF